VVSFLLISQVKQLEPDYSQVLHLSSQVIPTADPTGTSSTIADSAYGGGIGHSGGGVLSPSQTVQASPDPTQASHCGSQSGQRASPFS
jgi:hypothetical protein